MQLVMSTVTQKNVVMVKSVSPQEKKILLNLYTFFL